MTLALTHITFDKGIEAFGTKIEQFLAIVLFLVLG